MTDKEANKICNLARDLIARNITLNNFIKTVLEMAN